MKIIRYKPCKSDDNFERTKKLIKEKYNSMIDYDEAIKIQRGDNLAIYLNSELYLTCYVNGDDINSKTIIDEVISIVEGCVPGFTFLGREIEYN